MICMARCVAHRTARRGAAGHFDKTWMQEDEEDSRASVTTPVALVAVAQSQTCR